VTKNIKSNIPNNDLPDNMEGKKLYKPKFIPIYTDIRDKYKLKPREAQTFGFIKFYITSTGNKFYFSDKTLMKILGYSKKVLYDSLHTLEFEKGLIKTYTEKFGKRFIYLQDLVLKNEKVVTKRAPEWLPKGNHNNNNINNNINKEFLSETELFKFLNGKSEDKLPPLPF